MMCVFMYVYEHKTVNKETVLFMEKCHQGSECKCNLLMPQTKLL